MRPYRPVHVARKFFISVNGIRYCFREWGNCDQRPLLMLHGHLDSSASFQFLADRIATNHRVIAPDLRGFGESGWSVSGYAFEDYLADIDAIIGSLFFEPVTLIGHSLGGNLAMMFAGIRSNYVHAVVSLDGFGMSDPDPRQITAHYRKWLDAKRTPSRTKSLISLDDAAKRLMRANPKLTEDKAQFLAKHLTMRTKGTLVWRFDPAHRGPFPRPYRSADWLQAIQEIRAPVLWLGSDEPYPPSIALNHPTLEDRIRLSKASFHRVPGATHNLHHDAPDDVATYLLEFLATAS